MLSELEGIQQLWLICTSVNLCLQGILTLAEQQKLLSELEGDPTVVANLGLTPSKLPVSILDLYAGLRSLPILEISATSVQ